MTSLGLLSRNVFAVARACSQSRPFFASPCKILVNTCKRFSSTLSSPVQFTSDNVSSQSIDNNTNDAPVENEDLEIKDPSLIFKHVWSKMENKYGIERLRFPKEIIWLAGAPGAGKGTLTPFIMRERGITVEPICVSSILTSDTAQKIKKEGGLVTDRLVVEILFEKLLQTEYQDGVVVDGFPRTSVQGECIRFLYDQMLKLRREFFGTKLGHLFSRPTFRLTVLFVGETTSVERQLRRGRIVREHNERVRQSGVGTLMEERETDMSEHLAKQRYRVFKELTYESLMSLKSTFGYHFIDAEASIPEVKEKIFREFQYQSKLELSPDTYDSIHHIPLASEIVQHARQNLVKRLDHYRFHDTELFHQIIEVIDSEFVPIIRRQALSGRARIRSDSWVFEHKTAVDIVLDILSERGYRVVLDVERQQIITGFDPKSFKVQTMTKKLYHFDITFQKPVIRERSEIPIP
eukprot:TRINITY_DN10745_c0_g1_i1.p1 TRINITY_DN10745_c0_g1~~TRINITY_DN10745_c0_g1_i1.p1  ORF type:complete len:464 (-),score=90.10 TRINITY_DN10745_c0_g1_i1:353-1744(-)